ncbi:MAG: hypothetical protein GY950_12165 [bacterium]|nr:hypothetical protein [bacterium]
MKLTKILLTVLVCLIIAGTVAILTTHSYNSARLELEKSKFFLGQNKIKNAHAQFTTLKDSFWVKKQARLGRLITGIILDNEWTGATDTRLPGKETVKIDEYHLLPLLRRQLASAAFDRCIKLAKVGKYYGAEAADLYHTAALLEKGDRETAFEYYFALPDRLKNTVMGIRLEQTFELLVAGAKKIIRDRRGKLVGTIDADNTFKFYRPGYAAFIQPVMLKEIINSEISRGLRLSIDLELSRSALEALGEYRGSIVLVEPVTGELLAAVSDEKTIKKMGGGSSPAFEQMLEPASILKLITLTAAYRSNLDPNAEIRGMNCRGAKRYSRKILYCPSARGKLYGLDHALAVSCNTAFATLGVKVGWEKMLAELRLFGFDSQMKNPFSLGKIVTHKGDNRALADLAIGLENTVITPVHGALIAAVFANKGSWVYPELLSAHDGFIGFSSKKIERIEGIKAAKILDESRLAPIHDAMWAVTRYGGTAGFIAPIDFQVRMKTGTGGNRRDGFHVNYIGFGPGDEKNIAFCVRVTNKRTSSRIRRAGYRVTRELLKGLKELFARGGF